MPINWNEIAAQAGQTTDDHFKSQISNLIRLNNKEIEDIINETGISTQNLVIVLKEIKAARKSNVDKANAIRNINKGVDVLVELASKLL